MIMRFTLAVDPRMVDVIMRANDGCGADLFGKRSMGMSDEETLGVYAEQTEKYVAMVEKEAARDPVIGAFIAACPSGGAVLDLGCGPGHYAQIMAAAGLIPTAWDAVPEMVFQ